MIKRGKALQLLRGEDLSRRASPVLLWTSDRQAKSQPDRRKPSYCVYCDCSKPGVLRLRCVRSANPGFSLEFRRNCLPRVLRRRALLLKLQRERLKRQKIGALRCGLRSIDDWRAMIGTAELRVCMFSIWSRYQPTFTHRVEWGMHWENIFLDDVSGIRTLSHQRKSARRPLCAGPNYKRRAVHSAQIDLSRSRAPSAREIHILEQVKVLGRYFPDESLCVERRPLCSFLRVLRTISDDDDRRESCSPVVCSE